MKHTIDGSSKSDFIIHSYPVRVEGAKPNESGEVEQHQKVNYITIYQDVTSVEIERGDIIDLFDKIFEIEHEIFTDYYDY